MSACLCAAPDTNRVAWLHVFATDDPPGAKAAWESLWPAACELLRGESVPAVWVMTTQPWLIQLLRESGFRPYEKVVALSMIPRKPLPETEFDSNLSAMTETDLPTVAEVDNLSFRAPWTMDLDALQETFRRSALATVFRRGGRVLGYQLSLQTPQGVHLARLAVHPSAQGRGYGRAIAAHMLNHFLRRCVPAVTLNTQADNPYSFRLYHSLGFHETGEEYPCFIFPFVTPSP